MWVPCKGEVMSAISLALPKCDVSGADGYWEMLKGWKPANASVVIDGLFDPADTTGGSARRVTAEITRRYIDGDAKVHRHATDAFNAYAQTYVSEIVDLDKSRSRIGMAVGKIAKQLRADGFTVGASMANVGTDEDPNYVVVPWTFIG